MQAGVSTGPDQKVVEVTGPQDQEGEVMPRKKLTVKEAWERMEGDTSRAGGKTANRNASDDEYGDRYLSRPAKRNTHGSQAM